MVLMFFASLEVDLDDDCEFHTLMDVITSLEVSYLFHRVYILCQMACTFSFRFFNCLVCLCTKCLSLPFTFCNRWICTPLIVVTSEHVIY